MGGLFGGGSTKTSSTTNSSQTSGPTSFNQAYIADQFQNASNQLTGDQQTGPYSGQLYAPTNSNQQQAAAGASNFGMGSGNTLVNAGASGLAGLFNNAGNYSTNAENLATNGAGQLNATNMGVLNGYADGSTQANLVNGGLSSALNSAGTNGANSISGMLGTLQNVSNKALTDPTTQLSNDASTYMNSAPVQSAISSENNLINQQLNEQTLTGINQSAAMGGTLNSSRAGAANAEAQEGAALAEGSADSSILNNAYNTGLSTAANTYENGLSTAASSANMGANDGLNASLGTANLQNNEGQFNATTQLGAANSSLSQQLASQGLNSNTELNANSQLGQGIFDAALGTGNVLNGANTNMQLAGASGDLAQTNQQGIDNAGLEQFNNSNSYNWSNLGNYADLVDNPSYSTQSGTSTSNGTTTNSGPGVVGGVMGALSGLNGLTATGPGGTGTVFGNALNGLAGSLPSLSQVGSAMSGAAGAAGSGIMSLLGML